MDEVQFVVVFLDVVSGVLRLGPLRVDRIAIDAGVVLMAMQWRADDVRHQQQHQRPAEELRPSTPQTAGQTGARRGAVRGAKGKDHGWIGG